MAANRAQVRKNFARNIRLRRLSAGMSQTELAREMKERGFPYYQQTIQRVEDGERPVKLDEAFELASIFGVSVEALSWDRHGLRRREVSDLVGKGPMTIMDGVYKGSDVWLDAALSVAQQITQEHAQRTVNPRRVQAGVRLIEDSMRRMKRFQDLAIELEADYFEPLYKAIDPTTTLFDDDKASVDTDALKAEEAAQAEIAEALKLVDVDEVYSRLSLTDVANIWIDPDGPDARRILGSDFGPEPSDESALSDVYVANRDQRLI